MHDDLKLNNSNYKQKISCMMLVSYISITICFNEMMSLNHVNFVKE